MSQTITQIAKLDAENRELSKVYSAARIKIGLELALRLKQFEDDKLYLKLDEHSYPNFAAYLASIGIKYKTAKEIIGVLEAYVIAGGYSIEFLASIPYHKLTVIKPILFKKENNVYRMLKSRADTKRWIEEAKSDLTQEDLRQKRYEEEIGEHEHDFIKIRVCKKCKLKEIING